MVFIPYSLTPDGISFVWKGRSRNFNKSHANFEKIKAAIYAGDGEALEPLADIAAFIARISNGDVEISSDQVRWRKGERKVPKYLATRILEHVAAGEPIDPLLRLTEKLMLNPNNEILEDLYRWIEVGTMPIAEDGDIIAFKKVGSDYMSIQADRITKKHVDWGIGKIAQMPRSQCDERRHETCSTGLHFCSYDYLSKFGSGGETRIVILKINPEDITAIPTDYNHTKGRCCRAEVIGEVPEDEADKIFGRVVKSFGTYQAPPKIEHAPKAENTNTFIPRWDDDDDDSWDEDDESWDESEETEENNPVEVPMTNVLDSIVFKRSDGSYVKASDVTGALSAMSATKAAEFLNVPRSTLAGWRKKIENNKG